MHWLLVLVLTIPLIIMNIEYVIYIIICALFIKISIIIFCFSLFYFLWLLTGVLNLTFKFETSSFCTLAVGHFFPIMFMLNSMPKTRFTKFTLCSILWTTLDWHLHNQVIIHPFISLEMCRSNMTWKFTKSVVEIMELVNTVLLYCLRWVTFFVDTMTEVQR